MTTHQLGNPKKWFDALHQCQQQGVAYVLVTLLATAGSTPRNGGTKMLVSGDSQFDTIGGGQLELLVVKKARELLSIGTEQQVLEHFPLASKSAQCCGGATNVLFEVINAHAQQLAVFGAGHVAKALLPILAQLPLQITWVDQRADMFPAQSLGNNVRQFVSDEPEQVISDLAQSSWVLVLTHNHQLDYELVKASLDRGDLDFIGMIGSTTKARRFRTRLQHEGFDEHSIARLNSPVGMTDIPGKQPIEVAVSIAAQLIQLLNPKNEHKDEHQKSTQAKQQWLDSRLLTKRLVGSEQK